MTMDNAGALPEGARLFHIGPPKTGTTTLQAAASRLRPELLAAGVVYPGRTRNHRLAVAALLGRQTGWAQADGSRGAAPSLRHWYELLGELEASRGLRSWFGHEYAAHATPEVIERFAGQLGPSLEVVITLRSYARMLPSMWQEHLKAAGGKRPFDPWLRSMLLPPRREVDAVRQARHDHAALVEQWASVVGKDRVTVVVLDRADHGFVLRAFEELLALSSGLLDAGAGLENRSLGVAEVELLRRLNRTTRAHDVAWSSHERLVVQGAVARLLDGSSGSAPLRLPEWAVPLANAAAERTAAAVLASGVRVLGDPANLAEPAATGPAVDHRDVATVPMEVALDAVSGMFAVASGHEPDFGRTPEQVLRQLWRHAGEDVRALRDVGLVPTLGVAARRAAGAARGAGLAARGWLAGRRR